MAIAPQDPGRLAVRFRRGDRYSTLIDFSIDATGYDWDAEVFSIVTREVIQNPTLSVVSAANGQINLLWTKAKSDELVPGTYGVRVIWEAPGDVRRTATEGMLEVLP